MLLLDAHPVLEPEEVAEAARAVAFALSRVHAGGVAHGAVDVDHLRIGDDGLVALAPSRPPEGAASVEGDVRALGDLIVELLGQSRGPSPSAAAPPVPWWRWGRGRRRPLLTPPSPAEALAEIARQANPEEGSTPPSAATIAAQITLRVPGARPPGRRPPPVPVPAAAGPPAAASSRVGGAVFAVLLVALLAVAGAAAFTLHSRSSAPPVEGPVDLPSPTTVPTTLASRVWPLQAADGVLAGPDGDFTIGAPDDVVLAGDWLCRDEPLPALLRPATGEVFVFDHWPEPGEELAGRLVGTVAGAVRLISTGDPDHPCPRLAAVGADDTRVELETRP